MLLLQEIEINKSTTPAKSELLIFRPLCLTIEPLTTKAIDISQNTTML